jgi:lipopolysaccharide/colanic/teichoic acid biosynthesis glycosyltransferase
MSLVGPRPDVPGFADLLTGDDRVILTVRPGITGPATLAYRHEELLLMGADDPESHNRDVLWPDKVRLNRVYVERWTLATDLRCIAATIASVLDRGAAPDHEGSAR